MSKKFIFGERKKDWRDRSDKDCVCGGHSMSDRTKNLKHNGTYARYSHKLNRIFKRAQVRKALIGYGAYDPALPRLEC